MLIDVPSALERTRVAILTLGGEVDVCEVAPAATEAQVQAAEREIGRALPSVLRRLFVEQSASLRFCWSIEDDGRLPAEFSGGLSGAIDLSLADFPVRVLNWSGWRAAFENPAAHDWPVEFTVDLYERLFPLIATGNGDQIVIAEPEDPENEVVYLNHEGGDFDIVVLSENLEDFLNTWIELGCPGPEWWELARFLGQKTLRLSLKTRRSKAWLRALAAAGQLT
ncbi:MAG: SMI1/KNR4 family protein [Acidobacteria bacterium]|nr:SMI1/KNR4 family protein [Acidobacteriota bacterium]